MIRRRHTIAIVMLVLLRAVSVPAQQTEPAATQTEPAATQTQPAANLSELLEQGQQAIAAQDYPAAIQALTPVVEAQPDNLTAVLALAEAYLNAGQHYPALDLYKRVQQMSPLDWRAEYGMGSSYMRQGYFRLAQPFFERALRLAPSQMRGVILLELGVTLRGLHRTSEAIDVARQVLALDPTSLQARRLLIGLYGEIERFDAAVAEARAGIAQIRQTLAASPDDRGAVLTLNEYYAILNDMLLRQVIVRPQDPHLRLQLAEAAEQAVLAQQQLAYHQILDQIAEAVKVAPDDPQVRFAEGRLLYLTGRPGRAAESLRLVLQADPNHAEARQLLARIEAQAATQPASQPAAGR